MVGNQNSEPAAKAAFNFQTYSKHVTLVDPRLLRPLYRFDSWSKNVKPLKCITSYHIRESFILHRFFEISIKVLNCRHYLIFLAIRLKFLYAIFSQIKESMWGLPIQTTYWKWRTAWKCFTAALTKSCHSWEKNINKNWSTFGKTMEKMEKTWKRMFPLYKRDSALVVLV